MCLPPGNPLKLSLTVCICDASICHLLWSKWDLQRHVTLRPPSNSASTGRQLPPSQPVSSRCGKLASGGGEQPEERWQEVCGGDGDEPHFVWMDWCSRWTVFFSCLSLWGCSFEEHFNDLSADSRKEVKIWLSVSAFLDFFLLTYCCQDSKRKAFSAYYGLRWVVMIEYMQAFSAVSETQMAFNLIIVIIGQPQVHLIPAATLVVGTITVMMLETHLDNFVVIPCC